MFTITIINQNTVKIEFINEEPSPVVCFSKSSDKHDILAAYKTNDQRDIKNETYMFSAFISDGLITNKNLIREMRLRNMNKCLFDTLYETIYYGRKIK